MRAIELPNMDVGKGIIAAEVIRKTNIEMRFRRGVKRVTNGLWIDIINV